MKNLKISLLFLSLSLIVGCGQKSPDKEGTKDSGGDPQAQEFVTKALRLSLLFMENPNDERYTFKPEEFEAVAKKYDESLKDEKIRDLVEMVARKPSDKFGVEKPAVVNEQTGAIRVYRKDWLSFTDKERYVQVAMEIFRLLKVPGRYELAEAIVEKNYDYLVHASEKSYDSIFYSRREKKNPIDFQLSVDSLILDGGILLRGDAENKAGVGFLRDITSKPEWIEQILAAFKENRTVYVVYETEKRIALAIVGLHVSVKKGRIVLLSELSIKLRHGSLAEIVAPSGPCDLDSTKRTKLQRLVNCYGDPFYDHKKFVWQFDLPARFESEFGTRADENLVTLQKALLFNYDRMLADLSLHYMQAYGDTSKASLPTDGVREGYAPKLALAVRMALGMWPTLDSPLLLKADGTLSFPFWTLEKHYSLRDMRVYRATKILAEHNLFFEDSNFSCRDDAPDFPALRGPIVMTKELRDKYRANGKCFNNGDGAENLNDQLSAALGNAGYVYDYQKQEWEEGKLIAAAPNPNLDLERIGLSPLTMSAEFKGRFDRQPEIETGVYYEARARCESEAMTSAERVTLHLNQLKRFDLLARSIYLTHLMYGISHDRHEKHELFTPADAQPLYRQMGETLEQLISAQTSPAEYEDFIQGIVSLLTQGAVEPATATKMIDSLKKVSTNDHFLQAVDNYLENSVAEGHSPNEKRPYLLELANIALHSRALSAWQANRLVANIVTRKSYEQRVSSVEVDLRPDPAAIKILAMLIESKKASGEMQKTATDILPKLRARLGWKEKLNKLSTTEEKVSVTVVAIAQNPVEIAEEALYFAAQESVSSPDRDRIVAQVVQSLAPFKYDDLVNYFYHNGDASTFRSRYGAIDGIETFLFAAKNVSASAQLSLVEFLFAKAGTEYKLGVAATLTHMITGRWNGEESKITDQALALINGSLTKDDKTSREIVKELLEALAPSEEDRQRRPGLKPLLADPRPALKMFSENVGINPEYRQRFAILLRELDAERSTQSQPSAAP